MKCFVFFVITWSLALGFPLEKEAEEDPAPAKLIDTILNDPNDNSGWNGGSNNQNQNWNGGHGNTNTNWNGGAGNTNTGWYGGYGNQNQGWHGGYGK